MLKLEDMIISAFKHLEREKEELKRELSQLQKTTFRMVEDRIERMEALDAKQVLALKERQLKLEEQQLKTTTIVSRWLYTAVTVAVLTIVSLILLPLTRPEVWIALGELIHALRGL